MEGSLVTILVEVVGQHILGSGDGALHVSKNSILGNDVVLGAAKGIHLVKKRLIKFLQLVNALLVDSQHTATVVRNHFKRSIIDWLCMIDGTSQRVFLPIIGSYVKRIVHQAITQFFLLDDDILHGSFIVNLNLRLTNQAELRIAQAGALTHRRGEVENPSSANGIGIGRNLGNHVVALPVIATDSVTLKAQRIGADEHLVVLTTHDGRIVVGSVRRIVTDLCG